MAKRDFEPEREKVLEKSLGVPPAGPHRSAGSGGPRGWAGSRGHRDGMQGHILGGGAPQRTVSRFRSLEVRNQGLSRVQGRVRPRLRQLFMLLVVLGVFFVGASPQCASVFMRPSSLCVPVRRFYEDASRIASGLP